MNRKVLLALGLLLVLLFGAVTAAEAQSTCVLTVQAPNGTRVYVYEGTTQVASGTVGTSKSKIFTLDQDTYNVKLKQGAVYTDFSGVDCTGSTKTLDGLEQMPVQAPNGTRVYIYDAGNKLATSGTVGTSKTKTFDLVPRDDYKVKYKQGAVYTSFSPIDCTAGSGVCSHDGLSQLTVQAPNGTSVYVYDGSNNLATSGTVGTSKTKTFDVVPRSDYQVKYKQGAVYTTFSSINCSGATCSHDGLEQMTVQAPNGTAVYIYDGSNKQATSGTVGTSKTKTFDVVPRDDYKVKYKQGAVYTSFSPINCATGSALCSHDGLEQMTIQAPNGTRVYIYDAGNRQATSGTVGTSKTKSFDMVPRNDYKVKYKQGAVYTTFSPIDCGAAACSHDGLEELTVQAPNGTRVYIYDASNKQATSGTVGTSKSKKFDVVPRSDYKVKYKQGAVYTSFSPIDCSVAACAHNGLSELTVYAPNGTRVYIYNVSNQQATSGTVGTSKSKKFDVVRRSDYKIKYKQGAAYTSFSPIDCGGATCSHDALCAITVKAPNGTAVWIYKNGSQATSGTVGTSKSKTLDVVKYDDYHVKLKYAGNYYHFYHVDAKTTCPAVLDKSTLTVEFPGIGGVHTYVRHSDGTAGTASGANVASQTYKTDQAVFSGLSYGLYDIVVVKNAKTKIIDDVYVLGEVTVDNIVATLTVDFPGISSVHTYVKVNDGTADSATGGDVDNRTYKNDGASLVVLKNTYDVVVKKNAKSKIIDAVDCTGDTCTVEDIVATLTVKFPGISDVHTYVKVDDAVAGTAAGGDVDNRTYKDNETSLVVLKNTYDVMVKKNAKSKIIDAVDCTGDTCTVEDIVATLTVKFPGISSVHTYVKVNDGVVGTAAGGDVDNRTYKDDETSLAVLKNTYDVVVKKNAKTKIIDAVDCTGDTCTVEDIVATLTVKFPGISDVHTYVKVNDGVAGTATGGDVDNRTYKDNETSLVVLKNTYDVVVKKNAKTKIIDAVDCTGDTCTVENIVATLTVEFPGMSNVHVYVKVNDGTSGSATGGDVDNRTYQNNDTSLALLKNYYDVVLKKNSHTGIADAVNCTGNTCTLAGSSFTVKAPHNTAVQIKQDGSGSTVASGTIPSGRQRTFSNLPIGIYDVVLAQGAGTVTVENVFHIAGTSLDMLNTLTVKAPHNTQLKVQTSGGGVLTSGTVPSGRQKVLYVLRSNAWDLYLKQGAGEVLDTAMNNSGSITTVDRLHTLTVKAPHNTQVKVQNSSGGVLTNGTVPSGRQMVLYVLRDSAWDLYLKQGAGETTLGMDNSSASTTVNRLNTLTVKGPHNTAVAVQTSDGSGTLTSGTMPSGRQMTLYVLRNDGSDTTADWRLSMTQGAGNILVDSLGASTAATAVDKLHTLTVKAPHNTQVKVQTSGGGVLTGGTMPSGRQMVLYVLRDNAWDLYLKQGAGETTLGMDNSGASTTVDRLNTLTVKGPHNTVVAVQTSGGSGNLTSGTMPSGRQMTLYVLRNDGSDATTDWQLSMTQGAGGIIVNPLDASTGSTTVDKLNTLTVKGPHNTQVQVQTSGGGLLTGGTMPSGRQLTLYVLRVANPGWRLYLKQNAAVTMVAAANMDNSGPATTQDELCKLTVNGTAGTTVTVTLGGNTATGGTIPSGGTLTLYVVQNATNYDVNGQSVDCSGATASVTLP